MIGQTISHYKILAKLGEGGMGVVYKAEDTSLDRPVALKFLAPHLVSDAEIRMRFEREAKAAAALNHPNVCTVYEIAEAQGRTFIAMVFLEGEGLDKKIEAGPLKLKDALEIAIQSAHGLQAAHEKKIVHRDIKPANLMITGSGSKQLVTIMDFGLALLTDRSKLTRVDETMGTVTYMSPEQTYGMELDHRTDIWSLGVVIYEMVTGQQPFKGHYDKAVMYSITNEEPEPMTALRTGVPMELELLVNKCLAKEADRRYQSTADMVVDLETLSDKLKSGKSTILRSGTAGTRVGTGHGVPGGPERAAEGGYEGRVLPADPSPIEQALAPYHVIERLSEEAESVTYRAEDTQLHRSVAIRIMPESAGQKLAWRQRLLRNGFVAAAALSIVAVGLLVIQWRAQPSATDTLPLRKLSFTPPERLSRQGGDLHLAVSPNGRHIAFVAGDARTLWIRDLANEQAREMPGTENAQFPFWSPDSEFIAFGTEKELKKISVDGAATINLCEFPTNRYFGGSWSVDGASIVFASDGPVKLYEVPARGGSPKLLFEPEESEKGPHAVEPEFLPSEAGVRGVLFAQGSTSGTEIVVKNLETGERQVLGTGAYPRYSRTGHIVYQTNVREGGLWALPFSVKTLQPTGEAFPIAQNVGFPSIADDGTLVSVDFGDGGGGRQLVWRDREGEKLGTVGQPQDGIRNIDLSPDETRVAVTAVEADPIEIWVHEVERPVKTRITFSSGGIAVSSHWSPSGSELLFTSRREGSQAFDIYVKSADGTGEAKLVFGSELVDYASDWSTDGRYALADQHQPGTFFPTHVLLLERKDGGLFEGSLLLASKYVEKAAKLSPDGRYVAYVSDESGVFEVYVQRFPDGGGKLQISVSGGIQPRWRRDGTELFFVEGDALMVVQVEQGETLSVSAPELLFRSAGFGTSPHSHYDVSSDGQRFVLAEDNDANPPRIRVVQNWFAEFLDRGQN